MVVLNLLYTGIKNQKWKSSLATFSVLYLVSCILYPVSHLPLRGPNMFLVMPVTLTNRNVRNVAKGNDNNTSLQLWMCVAQAQ